MNKHNLEDRKREMKSLGFGKELIAEMEKNMEKGLPRFELHRRRPGTGGQLTHTIFFKKSTQSDFYYLNKFTVSLTKGQPLEGDLKYMVISPPAIRENPSSVPLSIRGKPLLTLSSRKAAANWP